MIKPYQYIKLQLSVCRMLRIMDLKFGQVFRPANHKMIPIILLFHFRLGGIITKEK